MAATTALAINYLLKLDDEVTPALTKVEKTYNRLTKSIEKQNDRMEKSITKTFGRMTALISGFNKSVTKATGAGGTSATSSKSDGLASQIVKGVSKALQGMSIRLHATLPAKKDSKFDTSTNLTRLYKKMAQPPDLVGLLKAAKVPRFAKGGKVPGSPIGPKDKVPALLTPGEHVVTQAQVAAARPRGANGQFLSNQQIAAMAAAAAKAGTPLGKFTAMMGKIWGAGVKAGKGLTVVNTGVRGLLKTIAGSATFLALHKAVETIQEDFTHLHNAAQAVNGEIGVGHQADSLITNFQQMNRVLGYTPAKLQNLRDEFIEQAKVLPLSVRNLAEMSEAMQHMVELGLGAKLSKDLTPAVYAFAQATGVAADASGELAVKLAKGLKMSVSQTGDTLAFISKVSKTAGVAAQSVTDAVSAAYEGNEALFKSLSPEAAQQAIQTLTKLAAAGEKVSPGFGKDLSGLVARGASGDASAFPALGMIGAGNQSDARALLQSPDKLFANLAKLDPTAMRALAEAMGQSADFTANMTYNVDDLNKSMKELNKVVVPTGKGMKELGEFADSNQSTFQRLRHVFTNLITSTFPGVIQFFSDLNPLLLISWVYLASKIIPALGNITLALIGLLPLLKKVGPLLKGSMATGVLGKSAGVLKSTWGWVVKLAIAVGGMLVTALGAATAAAWAFLAPLLLNPITWIVLGIVALIAGLVALVVYWDDVKKACGVALDWISSGFEAVGGSIGDWIGEMGQNLINFFYDLPSMLGKAVDKFASWLSSKMMDLLPDWVFSALNYAGVISDADLEGIKSIRTAATVSPVVPIPGAPLVTASKGNSNDDVVAALSQTNAHLAKITSNTEDLGTVQVSMPSPRTPSQLNSMLARGEL